MPGRGLTIRPDARHPVVDVAAIRAAAPATLPDTVDLRACWGGRDPTTIPTDPQHPVGPVKFQGEEGDCVALASSEMIEALRVQAGAPFLRLSARYLYNRLRMTQKVLDQDTGADPGDMLSLVELLGAAPEDDAPTVPGQFTLAMTPEQDDLAWQYRAASHEQMPDLDTARAILAGNPQAGVLPKPVTVCVPAYEDWENTGADGRVPLSIANETRSANHNVLWVGWFAGYDLTMTWGPQYGWGGLYCVRQDISAKVFSYMFVASLRQTT